MRLTFRTDDLPERRRFDGYLDMLGNALHLPLDVGHCSCGSKHGFFGRVATNRIADVGLSRIDSTGHVSVGRGGSTGHGEYLQFDLQIRGTGRLRQDGREVRLEPGDLSLFDTSKPFSWSFDSDFQIFVINVPRDMLPELAIEAGPRVASVIRGHSPLGRLVRDFVAQLVPVVDHVDAATGDRLVRAALELLQGAVRSFGSRGDPLPASAVTPTVDAARRYIDARLHDPALTVEAVAQHARVSSAHLQRLFRVDGQSVGDWIWQQRLMRTRALLEKPELLGWSLTRIAMETGFCDAAHFSRRFKAAFGVSPSAYRANCGANDGASREDARVVDGA